MNSIKFKKKEFTIFIFLGAVLVFLSRWRLFLSGGIIGHNWDWNIPFLKEQNKLAIWTCLFNWSESVFSYFSSPRIVNIFVYFIGALINGAVQTKVILFSVPFLSLVNSTILLSFLSKRFLKDDKNYGLFLGSITYAFAPSIFNDFVGGQLIYLIGYSFIPLCVYFIFKIFEEKSYGYYFFPLAIIFFILSGSHHWYFGLGFLLTIFLFFYSKKIKKLFLIVLVFLLSTAYNLIFILSQVGTIGETMPEMLKNESVFFNIMRSQKQTIDKVFLGAGFGDRNLFLNFLGGYRPVFFLLSYFVLIFILANLFLRIKSVKNKKLLFWSVFIYFLGLFLLTAGRSPMGDFFIFLMREIILFRAFRTVFHFFVLSNLAFSVLVAVSLSLFGKNKKMVSFLLIFVFLLAVLPTFIEGDNGWRRLKRMKKDSLDLYNINPDYLKILKSQFADPEWYRILIIPTTISPVYLQTSYQKEGQGGDPEVMYSPKPILNDFSLENENDETIYDLIEVNIIDDQPINQKLLGFLSFKRILRRRDIGQSFSSLADKYNNQVIDEKLAKLEPILTSDYVDYYDLDNVFFVPHFYIPDNFVYFSGKTEAMIDFVSSEDYNLKSAIVLSEDSSSIDRFDAYIINADLEDEVREEELENFQASLTLEPPDSPYEPGTFLYSLALIREDYDLKKTERSDEELLERYMFYANKRIAEILKYKFPTGGTKEEIKVLAAYKEKMSSALEVLRRIGKADNRDFSQIILRIKQALWWQGKQLKKLNLDTESLTQINEIFKYFWERIDKLKTNHDFSKFVYRFEVPKRGEYDLYAKDSGERWFLESRYFNEGEQRHILENEHFGENLIGGNLKIENYSPETIFKISFNYKALKGDSYLSVDEARSGEIFSFNLPSTGNRYEKFETLFKSSPGADKAFVYLSVSEYEDLRIERVRPPSLMLRLKRPDFEINEELELLPKISFTKINPTKYKVKIEGASSPPYTLVFSESFDKGWKAYVNKAPSVDDQVMMGYFDGKVKELMPKKSFLDKDIFETWGKKPISEERHLLVNDYANSWHLRPEDVDDLEDYELIIEFEPQKKYYLGLFTSSLTLISCFWWAVFTWLRKKLVDCV